ncbi:hypothetical protein D8674_013275 [Pyrus ussuriensis x Pyrus communis]|uniref:FLZ-type domain-containing protein n=1 Tax=Pyrus ussuriensis x Pyrus communis TaxID=2448454 RepID=A0A5N5GP85_9ROSA|nr:hypothetical protein D8674_013275 [Pyrus ussuriensis x Pyrus communis]
MLLGKRPRPPIRRTTSMTGIAVDMSDVQGQEPTDELQNPPAMNDVHAVAVAATVVDAQGPAPVINNNYYYDVEKMNRNNLGYHEEHRFLAMLSPRNNHTRRNSASHDVVETAHFLRTCGLCKRQLASGRDIYMYRGDAAFCSLECREQQMKQDERKEKCKAASSKIEDRHAASRSTSKASSGKGQTVAAA